MFHKLGKVAGRVRISRIFFIFFFFFAAIIFKNDFSSESKVVTVVTKTQNEKVSKKEAS